MFTGLRMAKSRVRGLITAALVLALLSSTPAAWASRGLGHRVIARIAAKHLSEKSKAAIKALLGDGESLAGASPWADDHRRELPETAPGHYVDVPLDEPAWVPRTPYVLLDGQSRRSAPDCTLVP